MNEVAIILGLLVRYGPEAYEWGRKLLAQKTAPTDAQWKELDDILLKTGDSYFQKVP